MVNIDPKEIDKFSTLAHQWWDPNGKLKTLHHVNPTRVQFIKDCAGNLNAKTILDVGCGAGILSESLAKEGANVTGIDMAKDSIEVAQSHLLESGFDIDYKIETVESHANEYPSHYDIITCMEMIEHVPDPESIIQSCFTLLKPGGQLFLSTLNRNAKSYLGAIIAAEYVLNLIPKGTHHYQKLVRPTELTQWVEGAQGIPKKISGLAYNPFTQSCKLTNNIDINYMLYAVKPE